MKKHKFLIYNLGVETTIHTLEKLILKKTLQRKHLSQLSNLTKLDIFQMQSEIIKN